MTKDFLWRLKLHVGNWNECLILDTNTQLWEKHLIHQLTLWTENTPTLAKRRVYERLWKETAKRFCASNVTFGNRGIPLIRETDSDHAECGV